MPIMRLSTITKANCTSLTPILASSGNRIGARMNITGTISMNMPRISISTFTRNSTT